MLPVLLLVFLELWLLTKMFLLVRFKFDTYIHSLSQINKQLRLLHPNHFIASNSILEQRMWCGGKVIRGDNGGWVSLQSFVCG